MTPSGRDLNELLVSSGLARIYGTRTPLPDDRDSREYLAHLHALEKFGQGCEARRVGHGAAVKDWKVIADNLSKAGWSWGCVSAVDLQERTIWIV